MHRLSLVDLLTSQLTLCRMHVYISLTAIAPASSKGNLIFCYNAGWSRHHFFKFQFSSDPWTAGPQKLPYRVREYNNKSTHVMLRAFMCVKLSELHAITQRNHFLLLSIFNPNNDFHLVNFYLQITNLQSEFRNSQSFRRKSSLNIQLVPLSKLAEPSTEPISQTRWSAP